MDELLLALERLLVLFEQPRKRSRQEGIWGSTSAYLKLMAGYGFARLGDPERANGIAREGFEQLSGLLHDEVHRCLADAFGARLEMAIDNRSRFARLPEELLMRRTELDRVATYKVQRLWEVSWILSPGFHREDAQYNFVRRVKLDRPQPRVFDLDASTEVLAARIGDHLESSSTLERDRRIARIEDCLYGLAELPELDAMPILTRAVQLIDELPDPPIELRVAVLQVIAQFGWGELVPKMFDPFAAQLATIVPERLGDPLLTTLQALRRLDLRDELSHVVDTLEPLLDRLRTENIITLPAACRLMIVAAMTFLDDPRGRQLLLESQLDLEKTRTYRKSDHLAFIRMMTTSYSLLSIPSAIEGIESLGSEWRDVTDNFGTNSHYCHAVLDFADSLIVGLTEARLGRGAP